MPGRVEVTGKFPASGMVTGKFWLLIDKSGASPAFLFLLGGVTPPFSRFSFSNIRLDTLLLVSGWEALL